MFLYHNNIVKQCDFSIVVGQWLPREAFPTNNAAILCTCLIHLSIALWVQSIGQTPSVLIWGFRQKNIPMLWNQKVLHVEDGKIPSKKWMLELKLHIFSMTYIYFHFLEGFLPSPTLGGTSWEKSTLYEWKACSMCNAYPHWPQLTPTPKEHQWASASLHVVHAMYSLTHSKHNKSSR